MSIIHFILWLLYVIMLYKIWAESFFGQVLQKFTSLVARLGCFVYIYNLLVFITLELLVRCFEQGPNIFCQMVMNKFSIYHGIPIRKIDHL